jgi:uncharacterized protein YggE
MKPRHAGALVLAGLLLVLATACGSSSSSSKKTIVVSDTATVKATPNLVQFSFGVSSDGATAKAALAANSAVMNRVIAALKNAGVPKRDIQTEQVSVYERTDSGGAVVGYSASNSVNVKLRKIGMSGALITKATAAGANLVSGPSFSIEDTAVLYSRALDRAYDKAEKKASTLAEHVGLRLGKPISIQEGTVPDILYRAAGDTMATSEKAPVPIEPGQTEITATVTVSFELR